MVLERYYGGLMSLVDIYSYSHIISVWGSCGDKVMGIIGYSQELHTLHIIHACYMVQVALFVFLK